MPATKAIHDRFGLNPKESLFVWYYVHGDEETRNNATQSAIAAGYAKKSARNTGPRMMKKDEIQRAIAELRQEAQERTEYTLDTVIEEIKALAHFDPALLFDDQGRPKPIESIPEDVRRAIGGIKVRTDYIYAKGDDSGEPIGESTIVEYKIWDKNAALEKLMKNLGGYAADKPRDPLLPDEIDRELLHTLKRFLVELQEQEYGGNSQSKH